MIDENDNIPFFINTFYTGHVVESSPNSIVLGENHLPLLIQAKDADIGYNSQLIYSIVEEEYRNDFTIDSSTGKT